MKREIMGIDYIDDLDKRIERHEAFWECEIIDRPVISMPFSRENLSYPAPANKNYSSQKKRWLDAEYQAELALYRIMNTEFAGDGIPQAFPNLGPEVFSSYFGMEMEFGDSTSWGIPNLHNWRDVDKIKFSEDNFYWQKTNEMMDAFLEVGKNKFYTGITDIHPGGDGVCAFRDPTNMNFDVLEYTEEIKSLLKYVTDIFFKVYDLFYEKLIRNKQIISTWMGPVSKKKWYIPSNDFSCMISPEMFNDIFLPGIKAECKFLDHSIYHLDGPDALRHLDILLKIPDLNAVQWVYGTGNGRASDWIDIYKKIQDAGKGMFISMQPDELDLFMENLKPNGIWIRMDGISSAEESDKILKKLDKWG